MLTFSRQMNINGMKVKVRMPRMKIADSNYRALVLWNGKWTKMEIELWEIDEGTEEKKYLGTAYDDNFMACEFCAVTTNKAPCANCTLSEEERDDNFRASGVPNQYIDQNTTKIPNLLDAKTVKMMKRRGR